MSKGIFRLILALDKLAPADQFLWSVWGFCVLEACSGGELVLPEDSSPWVRRLAEQCDGTSVIVRREHRVEVDPGQRFAVASSAGVVTPALMGCASTLYIFPTRPLTGLAAQWFWDTRWMLRLRALAREASAGILDRPALAELDEALDRVEPWHPPVSLISSVFKADRFLDHFLSDCAALKDYRGMEHWLIRPGSPGDEHAALLAHARRWPGAVYLNLESDPGLYEAWNLGCCLARGRYLSNANVDDRRHPRQIQRLVSTLDAQPSADLASAALRVTGVENQDWTDWANGRVFYAEVAEGMYGGPDLVLDAGRQLRPRNIPHCMPLWRRGLHGLRGFFNEAQYGPSADWEYWLRCANGGSVYYHRPEPLGLYLQREDSYWHQDPAARRFDDRILSRYGRIGAGKLPDAVLHGLPWRDLTRFVETGNWFGVMLTLVRLNARPGESGREEGGARRMASAYARRYFGLNEFQPLTMSGLYGGTNAVLENLQPVLFDWLHAFLEGVEADSAGSTRAGGCWRALLTDWHLQTGDVTPLIGLALLQRRLDENPEGERELLRRVHAREPAGFWRGVQRVYRHSLSLSRLNQLVDACRMVAARHERPSESISLRYFPAYANEYQQLLYQQAGLSAPQVKGIDSLQALARLPVSPLGENILHIHWLNAVFAGEETDFDATANRFLELVEERKRAGFRIFWTVHNRLNHDSQHPVAESRFRRRLARAVDRVYIHHPMVRGLLEWWPDDVEPWLCEHGAYPAEKGLDRTAARRNLGLPADARVFLWFGQIRPYKGLEDWLPTILETLAEFGNARLIIAGEVKMKGIRSLLSKFSDQAILIDRFVPDAELQNLASAADFGMLTYREILTSGAMFHLYSTGLPVIAPEQGTLPAYVVPGWNGTLYRDTASLDLALAEACRMDEETLNMRKAAAAETGASFRWGTVV